MARNHFFVLLACYIPRIYPFAIVPYQSWSPFSHPPPLLHNPHPIPITLNVLITLPPCIQGLCLPGYDRSLRPPHDHSMRGWQGAHLGSQECICLDLTLCLDWFCIKTRGECERVLYLLNCDQSLNPSRDDKCNHKCNKVSTPDNPDDPGVFADVVGQIPELMKEWRDGTKQICSKLSRGRRT